jgi:tripartite-type tricarboxylate transporter receptor subunit TctC
MKTIIAQLAEATATAAKAPDFDRVLEAAGLERRSDLTPSGARTFLTAERQHRIPIIKTAGLQPQ